MLGLKFIHISKTDTEIDWPFGISTPVAYILNASVGATSDIQFCIQRTGNLVPPRRIH